MRRTILGKIYKIWYGNVRQILQQLSAKWTQHENKPHPLIISTITNCGILRPATAAAESVDRLAHPSQRSC